MKTTFTSVFRPILYILFGLTITVACQKINPLDGVELTVNEEIAVSPLLVQFANANSSGTQLPDFNVTISGANANLVRMDGGATSFRSQGGFLPLYLISDAHPSASNPIKFNIYAEIPGFSPISQLVTITSDSVKTVDITAIEMAKPADGTSVSTATIAVTGGTVTTPQTIKTASSATMAETTTITLPAGTQIQDANGTPINANQVSTAVVYYDPSSPTSYSAFPGGYSPTNVVDANGQQINNGQGVQFMSAGLVSINMNAGNTAVKKFSQPITVSMELDPNTTNAVTGDNIKAGDIIPLWSLNEQTGQWKSEGNVTVKSVNGKLITDFQTTHLSCFNLDWDIFYGIPSCNNSLKVTLNIGAGKSGVYDVALVTPNNQYLAAAHYVNINQEKVITFPRVPNIKQAKIVISAFNLYLYPKLPILAETPLFAPCSQGAITLNYGAPAPPTYINLNVTIKGSCSNKNVTVLPTGWYNIIDKTNKDAGLPSTISVYIANGQVAQIIGGTFTRTGSVYSTKLISGHTYYIQNNYNNKLYTSPTFVISNANITLTGSDASGKGVYNSQTNTIDLAVALNINCN